MSEFEFIEAFYLALNALVDASMSTVAVTFAYIVAAYVAGKQLSQVAAIGMTTIYSLFLMAPLGGMLGACTQIQKTVDQYYASYPEGWAFEPISVVGLYLVSLLPVVLGWMGSLAFLHLYVRRHGT